jgi:hypothetical protein
LFQNGQSSEIANNPKQPQLQEWQTQNIAKTANTSEITENKNLPKPQDFRKLKA